MNAGPASGACAPGPGREHVHELDLLRGIACAVVVAFHYLHRGQQDHWLTDTAPPWLAAIARFGDLGVHLFFMISGFVIFMSAEEATLRVFAASRIARLFPALWVAAPITAGAAWVVNSGTFAVGPGTLLLNLTMLPQWFGIDWVDGAYWSLAVELQFYLLMAAVIACGALRHTEKLLFAWLALTVVDQLRPVYPLEFWLAARWAPYFCIGIVCYRVRRNGLDAPRAVLLGLAWLLTVTAWLRKVPASPDVLADVLVPALVMTVCFVVFLGIALRRWRWPASRMGVLAGALTYPVYLVHQNLGYLLIEAAKPTGLPFLLRVLNAAGLVIVVAWIIHHLIEKPLGRWLRVRLSPSPSAASQDRAVSAA